MYIVNVLLKLYANLYLNLAETEASICKIFKQFSYLIVDIHVWSKSLTTVVCIWNPPS